MILFCDLIRCIFSPVESNAAKNIIQKYANSRNTCHNLDLILSRFGFWEIRRFFLEILNESINFFEYFFVSSILIMKLVSAFLVLAALTATVDASTYRRSLQTDEVRTGGDDDDDSGVSEVLCFLVRVRVLVQLCPLIVQEVSNHTLSPPFEYSLPLITRIRPLIQSPIQLHTRFPTQLLIQFPTRLLTQPLTQLTIQPRTQLPHQPQIQPQRLHTHQHLNQPQHQLLILPQLDS